MKLHTSSLAPILVAATLVTGCAMEEAEAGEAAYPAAQAPVGITPPPRTPPADAVAASQPVPPPPPYGQDGQAGGEPVAASPGEVAIGAEDESGEGDAYSDTDPAALSDFRSTLEPYGTWTEDPTYGTVWVPSPSVVGQDFTPYVSAGHWVYDTDYAWASDYDWGWAPFHYGRWVYVAGAGWEWIPGRAYAGAWVSWRYGVGDWGYVGWAPLPPTWCWHHGVAVGIGFVPRAPYAFVGTGELFAPSIGARVIGGAQVGVIAGHTRPYVPATPVVGTGRVPARPAVGGPPPSDLHIAPATVASASMSNRGLAQAHAFSTPGGAMAMGARPPQGSTMAMRSSPAAWSQGRAAAPVYRSSAASYGAPASVSHFGGRFGGGFTGSVAASPPMRAPSYSTSNAVARPYFGSSVRSSSPPSAFRSASPGATFRSAPSYHPSSPVYSSGGYRGGAASSGAFHSGGGGGFHGGGGGFHGGGGGGGHGGHR
jgi:hypothetical protein